MEQMIPPLSEIVGVPAASAAADIVCASEQRFRKVLDRAAQGDPGARRDLLHLRVAYLNWAYVGQNAGQSLPHP